MSHSLAGRRIVALCVLGSLGLASGASAQARLSVERITAKVRNAGVLRLATGTWDRTGSALQLGSKVLFNHSAPSGYYNTQYPFHTTIGEGRIPSLDSEGNALAYRVDGFELSYCTGDIVGPNLSVEAIWYNHYRSCEHPTVDGGLNGGPSELVGQKTLQGLPGTLAVGTQSCWVVTIDMTGTTSEFVLPGDADGVFDDDSVQSELDGFGWSLHFPGVGNPSSTGSQISGHPINWPFGAGTDPAWGFAPGPLGTGLDERDQFFIISTTDNSTTGCHWFGGFFPPWSIWGGLHQVLYGEPVINARCDDVPLGNYCVNNDQPFSTGPSAISANATSISIGANNLVLTADNLPLFQFGIFIAGPTQADIPFFNGHMCIDPQGLQRLDPVAIPNASGVAQIVVGLGSSAGGGPVNVTPGEVYHFQRWNRDPAGGGGNANFSNAISICFSP